MNKGGGEEISKLSVDFAIHRDLGKASFPVKRLLDGIVARMLGIANDLVTAKHRVAKFVDNLSLSANLFPQPTPRSNGWRWEAKVVGESFFEYRGGDAVISAGKC